MAIVVRAATAADQPVIRRIVRQARINPTGLAWPRFVVAEADGQVVGTGQVKPHRDGSRELASIATVPLMQHRGVAREIIEALLAREQGALYLVCRAELVPFYERFGFRVAARRELPAMFRLMHPAMRMWGGRIMRRDGPHGRAA
jgi:N-acetylglutamate synthase-like GNAT family acetyltransferase